MPTGGQYDLRGGPPTEPLAAATPCAGFLSSPRFRCLDVQVRDENSLGHPRTPPGRPCPQCLSTVRKQTCDLRAFTTPVAGNQGAAHVPAATSRWGWQGGHGDLEAAPWS